MKSLFILSVLLGLAGCGTQPLRTTHNGQPCHQIGYPWSPAMVAPDNKTLCW